LQCLAEEGIKVTNKTYVCSCSIC